ncbi:hypothetical protein Bca52824_001769 [Brassica carinata]|uniref:FBD domain-containing protein n=1 Tax=Brassica carinata TaxID=52824 RepID=A0A8X7WIY9_BRACI|nr:hypothetical protein Bca52824_001769 [Brassica carinata]
MSITEANTVTDRKAISPDDLTSSDNPGVTVFFPLTISTNYDEWATKILMEVLTLSIKKFGSTDKSITEPAASSSTLEVWNGRYSAVRNFPITEKATEQEVVRYFLGNATSLKKLVLRLNVPDGEKHEPGVLKHRFDSPRRSSLCHFDVLLVVQTSDKMKEL